MFYILLYYKTGFGHQAGEIKAQARQTGGKDADNVVNTQRDCS